AAGLLRRRGAEARESRSAADHHHEPDEHRHHEPRSQHDRSGEDRGPDDRPYRDPHRAQSGHGADRGSGALGGGHGRRRTGRRLGSNTVAGGGTIAGSNTVARRGTIAVVLRGGEAGAVRERLVDRLVRCGRGVCGGHGGGLLGGVVAVVVVVVVVVVGWFGSSGLVGGAHRLTSTVPTRLWTSRVSTGPDGSGVSVPAGQSTRPTSLRQVASTFRSSGSRTRTSPTLLEML